MTRCRIRGHHHDRSGRYCYWRTKRFRSSGRFVNSWTVHDRILDLTAYADSEEMARLWIKVAKAMSASHIVLFRRK